MVTEGVINHKLREGCLRLGKGTHCSVLFVYGLQETTKIYLQMLDFIIVAVSFRNCILVVHQRGFNALFCCSYCLHTYVLQLLLNKAIITISSFFVVLVLYCAPFAALVVGMIKKENKNQILLYILVS